MSIVAVLPRVDEGWMGPVDLSGQSGAGSVVIGGGHAVCDGRGNGGGHGVEIVRIGRWSGGGSVVDILNQFDWRRCPWLLQLS